MLVEKNTVFFISIVGIAFSIFFFSLALASGTSYIKPISKSVQQVAFIGQNDVGLPIRLKIPKINVDATIDYVGLTKEGRMDVPIDPDDTAWFNLGPRPGELGSAVIDGHSGWKNNIPAVFDHLYRLKKGDKVYIEDEKGTKITFIVREIRTYDPMADASSVFSSSDGKTHLNLITCKGIWNEVTKSSSKRLVVFTEKE